MGVVGVTGPYRWSLLGGVMRRSLTETDARLMDGVYLGGENDLFSLDVDSR